MQNLTVIENQLLPVYIGKNHERLVNARELHQFLESKQRFADWIKNRIEKYGFIENIDYVLISQNYETSTGGTVRKEYILKMDVAKEIAMVENNDRGRQARKYFIEVEKKYKEREFPSYMIDDPIVRAEKWIEEHKRRQRLEKQNQLLVHSRKLYTSTEIAKELGFTSAQVLNKDLENKKVQYKVNNTWVLHSKYADLDYVSIKNQVLDNGKVIYDRKWTGLGRQFLLNLYKGE